jgi:hypothetical protein
MPDEKKKNHNPNESNPQDNDQEMENTQTEMSMENDWENDPKGALGGEVTDADIIDFYPSDEADDLTAEETSRGDNEAEEDEEMPRAA